MEAMRREVFERDGYRCQHRIYLSLMDGEMWKTCLNPVTWENGHLAHIIPRSLGGKDEESNCVCKCAFCHIRIEHSYGPSGVKPVPKKPRP